jgi:hypothetical protein
MLLEKMQEYSFNDDCEAVVKEEPRLLESPVRVLIAFVIAFVIAVSIVSGPGNPSVECVRAGLLASIIQSRQEIINIKIKLEEG